MLAKFYLSLNLPIHRHISFKLLKANWNYEVNIFFLFKSCQAWVQKLKKHLITNKFKIKSAVPLPYDIMLCKVRTAPIETIAMVRFIMYIKRIEKIEEGRWPKVVFNGIVPKKRTWMQQKSKCFFK